MELYEIQDRAMFDEPVDYKGIKIYPITIRYYHLVKACSHVFAINPIQDKDPTLLGLPYMEYMMTKTIKEPEFIDNWQILNAILEISFKDQFHSFKFDGDFLKMYISIPTDKYNEETMCVYREKLNKYNELAFDEYHRLLNELQIKRIKEEIEEMAKELFVTISFNDKEFDEIKSIICYMNDIDTTVIDPMWEVELKKASENMAKINAKQNSPNLEDLIDAVSLMLGKLPSDIMDMTVRRFDRILELELNKEDYVLCRQAELNGTKFKRPLTHWIKAYKPKGRYEGAQNTGESIQDVLKE
jgi:hypothetical protein